MSLNDDNQTDIMLPTVDGLGDHANKAFSKETAPEGIKHFVILHAGIFDVDRIMTPLGSRLERSELIQPCPKHNITGIYSHTKEKQTPDRKREISVLKELRDTIKPELCVVATNETKSDIKNSLMRVKFINKYLPDTKTIFVCDTPEQTIQHLDEMGKLHMVGADNVISFDDSKGEILKRTNAQTNQSINNNNIFSETDKLRRQYGEMPCVIAAHNISNDLHNAIRQELSRPTQTGVIRDNLLREPNQNFFDTHCNDL